MLNRAWTLGYPYFVIVSHSFELLTPDKSAADGRIIHRFERLLKFLDEHRDRFRTIGFKETKEEIGSKTQVPLNSGKLRSNLFRTGLRIIEQAAGPHKLSGRPE
jgi:hypothetical protein